jgi:hypothetical protein
VSIGDLETPSPHEKWPPPVRTCRWYCPLVWPGRRTARVAVARKVRVPWPEVCTDRGAQLGVSLNVGWLGAPGSFLR